MNAPSRRYPRARSDIINKKLRVIKLLCGDFSVRPRILLATNFKLPLTEVLIFNVLLFLFFIFMAGIDCTNHSHRHLITYSPLFIACSYVTRFSSSRVVPKRPGFLFLHPHACRQTDKARSACVT